MVLYVIIIMIIVLLTFLEAKHIIVGNKPKNIRQVSIGKMKNSVKNHSKETKTSLRMITISYQKNAKTAFFITIYAAESGMGDFYGTY